MKKAVLQLIKMSSDIFFTSELGGGRQNQANIFHFSSWLQFISPENYIKVKHSYLSKLQWGKPCVLSVQGLRFRIIKSVLPKKKKIPPPSLQ